ncbi:MAG: uracil-DNA glycosylase family protein [Calditrichaceae bacterium]
MRLPLAWETWLDQYINFNQFYADLEIFINQFENIIPKPGLIFNVFSKMRPEEVRCVLFGEDPYPRITSANGIAFWDLEIQQWDDKTNGNSLKNMLKGLLIAKGLADYKTSIAECRKIAREDNFMCPPQLFEHWLRQGVFLINSSLTFSSIVDKNQHFDFWRSFHSALIHALNVQKTSPYYILWGRKAQQWEKTISKTIDQPSKIIKQGHPTFIHQFLDAEDPGYSPFTDLQAKTNVEWF